MDVQKLVIDHGIVQLGGAIEKSSFDNENKTFQKDVSFIVEKIQPSIGLPEVQTVSFIKAPSKKWLIIFTNRIRKKDTRDFYFNHILWLTQEQLNALRFDISILAPQFSIENVSSLPNNLDKLKVSFLQEKFDLNLIKKNITKESLLSSIYLSIIGAVNSSNKLVIISNPPMWEFLLEILKILPRQVRQVSFLGHSQSNFANVDVYCTSLVNYRNSFYEQVSKNQNLTIINLLQQEEIKIAETLTNIDENVINFIKLLSTWVFNNDVKSIISCQKYFDNVVGNAVLNMQSLSRLFDSFTKFLSIEKAVTENAIRRHIDYSHSISAFNHDEAIEHLRQATKKSILLPLSKLHVELISSSIYNLNRDIFFENVSLLLEKFVLAGQLTEQVLKELTFVNEKSKLNRIFLNIISKLITNEKLSNNSAMISSIVTLLSNVSTFSTQEHDLISAISSMRNLDLQPSLKTQIHSIEAEIASKNDNFRKKLAFSDPSLLNNLLEVRPTLSSLISDDILSSSNLNLNQQKYLLRQYYLHQNNLFDKDLFSIYLKIINNQLLDDLDQQDLQIIKKSFTIDYKNKLAKVFILSCFKDQIPNIDYLTKCLTKMNDLDLINKNNAKYIIDNLSKAITSLKTKPSKGIIFKSFKYDFKSITKPPSWLELIKNISNINKTLKMEIIRSKKFQITVINLLKNDWKNIFNPKNYSIYELNEMELKKTIQILLNVFIVQIDETLQMIQDIFYVNKKDSRIKKTYQFGVKRYINFVKFVLLNLYDHKSIIFG